MTPLHQPVHPSSELGSLFGLGCDVSLRRWGYGPTNIWLVLALFATHLVYLAIMLALLYVTSWKLEVKWSILASYHQLRSFREMSQWVFRGCDTGRLNSFGCQWDSTQNSVRAVLHSQFLDLHHLDVSKGTFLKSFYGSFVVVSLL